MTATHPHTDARIFAPAAARNRDAIRDQVIRVAPASGRALEIASGSGEHVVHIAPSTPGLSWQPTDPDPVRRASIDAWRARAECGRIAPAAPLDAAAPGWHHVWAGQDLILLVNLLHLIATDAASVVLAEIARALAPGGVALIYGPFLRDGQPTSPGDARFHADLRAQDPATGLKDIAWIRTVLQAQGTPIFETIAMPANNLMVVARKPQEVPHGA